MNLVFWRSVVIRVQQIWNMFESLWDDFGCGHYWGLAVYFLYLCIFCGHNASTVTSDLSLTIFKARQCSDGPQQPRVTIHSPSFYAVKMKENKTLWSNSLKPLLSLSPTTFASLMLVLRKNRIVFVLLLVFTLLDSRVSGQVHTDTHARNESAVANV